MQFMHGYHKTRLKDSIRGLEHCCMSWASIIILETTCHTPQTVILIGLNVPASVGSAGW